MRPLYTAAEQLFKSLLLLCFLLCSWDDRTDEARTGNHGYMWLDVPVLSLDQHLVMAVPDVAKYPDILAIPMRDTGNRRLRA
jgi:hypothetical protein